MITGEKFIQLKKIADFYSSILLALKNRKRTN